MDGAGVPGKHELAADWAMVGALQPAPQASIWHPGAAAVARGRVAGGELVVACPQLLGSERACHLVSPVQPQPPPVLAAFSQWLGQKASGTGTAAAAASIRGACCGPVYNMPSSCSSARCLTALRP